MNKCIEELVTKLDERGLSEVNIHNIIVFSNSDEKVINELINYVDNTNKTKQQLMSDLLKLVHHLKPAKSVNKSEKKNTYKIEDKSDAIPTSIHSIEYERESNSNELLNVTYNLPNVGELKILESSSKLNYFSVNLSLAYMDLLELENNSRESFRKIDLYNFYDEKTNYSFQSAIEQLDNDIDNYKQIIIWTKHKDTNAYLVPYYFINKFYDKIKEKKIMLIYTDELPECNGLSELRIGQFEELLKTVKVLTKEEINNYSSEWNKIVSHKCDIRNLTNDKLEYKNIEDYYDTIKELLKKNGEIYRVDFICELMDKNVLCGGIPDIYSYIIDTMIEKDIISSQDYKVPCFIPNDKISLK